MNRPTVKQLQERAGRWARGRLATQFGMSARLHRADGFEAGYREAVADLRSHIVEPPSAADAQDILTLWTQPFKEGRDDGET